MRATQMIRWIPLLGLLFATPAFAEGMWGLGLWTGAGVAFGPDGKPTSSFTVELTRTAVGSNTVQLKGTAKLANGDEKAIDQKSTYDGNRFQIESSRGHGSGVCLGEGICTSYEDHGNGQGVATTIVIDAPDKMRILMTELDQGQTIRFIRQSLTRKP